MSTLRSPQKTLLGAGTLIGIGMGAFVDGILLHQLLQLHNMLSAKYPTVGHEPQRLVIHLEINMFWDGMFHVFAWTATALGIALLWKSYQQALPLVTTLQFTGTLCFGWGLFNLVEGLINHHLLHLHHVVEIPQHFVYDLMFLASGVLLMIAGWWMVTQGDRAGDAGALTDG